jgi:hypothetical protein
VEFDGRDAGRHGRNITAEGRWSLRPPLCSE